MYVRRMGNRLVMEEGPILGCTAVFVIKWSVTCIFVWANFISFEVPASWFDFHTHCSGDVCPTYGPCSQGPSHLYWRQYVCKHAQRI